MGSRWMVIVGFCCFLVNAGCGAKGSTRVHLVEVPRQVIASKPFRVHAELITNQGQRVESKDDLPIDIALYTNPAGATLSGTLVTNPRAGQVTFNNLRIDKPGEGYRFIVKSSDSLDEWPEVSLTFDVILTRLESPLPTLLPNDALPSLTPPLGPASLIPLAQPSPLVPPAKIESTQPNSLILP